MEVVEDRELGAVGGEVVVGFVKAKVEGHGQYRTGYTSGLPLNGAVVTDGDEVVGVGGLEIRVGRVGKERNRDRVMDLWPMSIWNLDWTERNMGPGWININPRPAHLKI